jgi:hypothetical protein
MDLSKLPRLSKTEAGAPDEGTDSPAVRADPQPVVPTPFCRQCGAPLRADARFCDSCGAPTAIDYASRPAASADPGVGAEAWVSALIGVILILVGRSFGGYLAATLTGQPYHTNVTWMQGPKEGQEVAYWELQGFTALSDSAIFLFGLTMVLEAVVLALVNTRFKAKVSLVTVALFVTVLVTAYNAVVALRLIASGILPITSLLAVAFGGYIAIYEWRLLQQLRPAPRADVRR